MWEVLVKYSHLEDNGAGLDMTLDHKELLKDIYRSVC